MMKFDAQGSGRVLVVPSSKVYQSDSATLPFGWAWVRRWSSISNLNDIMIVIPNATKPPIPNQHPSSRGMGYIYERISVR